MAYFNGTATDYLDLLATLETNAAANGWTVESSTYDEVGGTDGELILNGEGLSASEEIIVGIESYSDAGSDRYNWKVRGFTAYDGSAFANLPGSSRELYLPLSDGNIGYWMMINAQRILLVAKIGTVYVHMYLGFVDTFASAQTYAYPLYIGAMTTDENDTVSSDATVIRAYWAENSGNSDLYLPSGQWAVVSNGNVSDTSMWPTVNIGEFGGLIDDLRDGISGFPLLPTLLVNRDGSNDGVLGQLDGVYWTSGFGLTVEDIIDVSTQDHLVAQDSTRVTDTDFIAVELA